MQTDKTSKLGVIAFGKIKQFEKKIKEVENRLEKIEEYLENEDAVSDAIFFQGNLERAKK